MKVRDLIDTLEATDKDATVFIATARGLYDFNGASINDGNIVLYTEPEYRR